MKTIWLIWWMSWESSLEYYRIINEKVKEKLWWLHSASSLMYSFDFQEIEHLQHLWDWDSLTKKMINAAKDLEKGWADFVVICTNTMHKMANDVQNNINIPLLHIADSTAELILKKWIKNIWLLWTKFTMEHDFYKWRLIDKFWLNVITPNDNDRNIVHNIIYNELCLWEIKWNSKNEYIKIINDMIFRWAEWVILWCTEITLLIKQNDVNTLIFDTTQIHAEAAVEYALE